MPKKYFYIDKRRCLGCKTCELSCAVGRNSYSRNLASAVREPVQPTSRVHVYYNEVEDRPETVHCMHCENAPCMEICSTGALNRDEVTGVVFIDTQKCIGCYMCVMSCPYGLITPVTARGVADKCDRCYKMEEPYCVASCPTGAARLCTLEELIEALRNEAEEKIVEAGKTAIV